MRILWCHPSAWCGEYAMMAHLSKSGHDICVLQEDRKRRKPREFSEYHTHPNDSIRTLWYNPGKGIEKTLTFAADRVVRRYTPYRGNIGHRMWMIKVATSYFKPDLVYCSEAKGYGIPAALLKKIGLLHMPLVIQSIGGDLLDEPSAQCGTRRTPAMHWMLNQVMRQATLLKPVSPLLAEIMEKEGASGSSIRICPSHLVAPRETLEEIYRNRLTLGKAFRIKHNIPVAAPLIISLSANRMGKGVHLLAEAWPKIRELFPSCRWILAGPHSEWYTNQVKPQVEKFPSEIILLGELQGDGVFEALATADLNVNPTLADGLNMVTVEAAAVGTPSIVTDKAGISYWLSTRGINLISEAGNNTSLIQFIVSFLSQSQEEKNESSLQFRELSTEFQLENIADRLTSIWEEAFSISKLQNAAK